MDNLPEGVDPDALASLSYDEIAYEDQISINPSNDPEHASLANRISSNKVYLLSESSTATRVGKRKHENEGEEAVLEDDAEMEEDLSYRPNALLFHGSPIADLPTARIFAYATHFDAHPLGLEWVDDNTCVLVFESKSTARSGYRYLQKSATEEPDLEGFVTARPIPVALWPPEKRINNSLGKGEGLKGIIRMRWARGDDVKKKGAKRESEFYRKHGTTAGKELYNGRDLPPPKRRRRGDDPIDEEAQRAKLDNELDEFLAEEDVDVEADAAPASPPSKMRSDYIANDGRTLLERTSLLRAHPEMSDPVLDLAARLTAPLPRRARGGRGRRRSPAVDMDLGDRLAVGSEKLEWGREDDDFGERHRNRGRGDRGRDDRGSGRSNRRGERIGGGERPRKTQQELDDELDAFLNADA